MRRVTGLTVVFVVTALAITSHYMAAPLVPLAAARTGAGPAGVGLASGVFALLPLLLAVPVGLLADRTGQARVAVAGTALMAATTAALVSPWFVGLLGAQALRGLGQVSLMIGMQAFIAAQVASGPRRQTAYSSFVLAVSIGQLAGPVLGGWATDRFGLSSAFLVAAGLASAATLLGLRISGRRVASVRPAAQPAVDLKGAFDLMRDRPTKGAVSVSVFVLMQVTLGTAFYPLLLRHAGVSVAAIGLLVGMRGAGACLGRPCLPGLLRLAKDRWRLLRVVFCVICLATAATPLTPAFWYQALISVLTGMTAGIAQPITMAVVADRAGENRVSQGVSLRVGSNRLLQLVGPLALGFVGARTGLDGTFVVGGLAPLVALATLHGLSERQAAPVAGGAGLG